MPELPEVEHARSLLERFVVGQRIVKVRVGPDTIVCAEDRPQKIAKTFRNAIMEVPDRRGKQLWLPLVDRPAVLVHLGMTGAVRVRGEQGLQLVAHGSVEEHWPPRFEKFWLKLENEVEVAFTDPRRFGRLRLRKDPLHEPPISDLGPDPIVDEIDMSAVSDALLRRRAPIKSVLLDQKFMAGVGNWIADEACYQAKLNPHRLGVELEPKEAKSLVRKTIAVIQKACSVDAEKDRFPRSWLFHNRWGKVQGARTAKGELIQFDAIGGRITAWVPVRQN